jgi:hypothetical protein
MERYGVGYGKEYKKDKRICVMVLGEVQKIYIGVYNHFFRGC